MPTYPDGYYPTRERVINPNLWYILNLENIRYPKIWPLACKNKFLAHRQILLKLNPIFNESIKGSKVIKMDFYIKEKYISRKFFPVKYDYPSSCDTIQKRKSYRTHERERILQTFNKSHNTLKQFTLKYKGKTYSVHHFTIFKAFNALNKASGMGWKHFIKKVSNKPQEITPWMIFVKRVNITTINQFNKVYGIDLINRAPNVGKVSNSEKPFLSTQKQKPYDLLL